MDLSRVNEYRGIESFLGPVVLLHLIPLPSASQDPAWPAGDQDLDISRERLLKSERYMNQEGLAE